MLVLGRKCGERIMIGNDIEIVVTEVRGGKVRLGFNAPEGVSIHREEVRDRIEAADFDKRLVCTPRTCDI